jgi:hypothetical protein
VEIDSTAGRGTRVTVALRLASDEAIGSELEEVT